MREILFRGKRKIDSEWIDGFYAIRRNGEHLILWAEQTSALFFKVYDVDPATVGQFTGLFDKNGNKIFEGDVVMADLDFSSGERVNLVGKIVFEKGMFCFSRLFLLENGAEKLAAYHNVEVIGNVHDDCGAFFESQRMETQSARVAVSREEAIAMWNLIKERKGTK
jgi:uncharacterized phage protein (TIGR01671 family)